MRWSSRSTAIPPSVAVARRRSGSRSSPRCSTCPPRQRAVLILREVLQWSAAETAELLGTTVASVNSALQRARATMGERELDSAGEIGAEQQELLDRYADAFERYDMTALVSLLHEDAVMSMPPYALWLVGHRGHRRLAHRPRRALPQFEDGAGHGQRHARVRAVQAVARWRGYMAWAIQAPEIRGDKIVAAQRVPRRRGAVPDVRAAAHAGTAEEDHRVHRRPAGAGEAELGAHGVQRGERRRARGGGRR